YEIKDLTPPQETLRAMQAQITAEREKRALIAQSEGKRQEQINLAEGERSAAIAASEGERAAAVNAAEGEATALRLVADATADAIAKVASSIQIPGGYEAVNLKVAERYVDAFEKLAKTNNTMIIPANTADVAGMITTAMSVIKQTK
ncbi:MAG: paraslipin, partial [Micavibrio aeruginosavorus]